MRRHRVTCWLALGLTAAMVDAQSLAAILWLARCSSGDMPAAVRAALRIDQHVQAYPWTMAVMVLACLAPARGTRRTRLRTGSRALLVMVLSMPLACLLAAPIAARVATSWQPLAFAVLMLAFGTLHGLRGRHGVGTAAATTRPAPGALRPPSPTPRPSLRRPAAARSSAPR